MAGDVLVGMEFMADAYTDILYKAQNSRLAFEASGDYFDEDGKLQ